MIEHALQNLPPRSKLEWVVWKDACADSSRVSVDSIQDVRLVTNTNLGWAIHEDDERLVLAHGMSTSGEIDHFVIPTNCIVERKPLFARAPSKGKAGRAQAKSRQEGATE